MKKLSPLLLVLAFIISVVTGVFLPFSAHAASLYDNAIQVVPMGQLKLYDTGMFGGPNTDSFDVSTDFTKYITNPSYWCSSPGSNPLETSTSFSNEISSPTGSWAISIHNSYSNYGGGKKWSSISIVWTVDDSQLQGVFSNDPFERFRLANGSTVNEWLIYPVAFSGGAVSSDNTTGFCGASVPNTSTDYLPDISNQYGNNETTNQTSSGVFVFNSTAITYPDGYQGAEAPGIVASDVYRPQIGYSVDDKQLLRAQYLRNLDTQGVINTLDNTNYKWTYRVYSSDSDYNEGTQLDAKDLNGLAPYEFQLPSRGYYLLNVSLSITPPAAPRTDIKPVTFQINADGTFKIGSTTNLDCTDGVCKDLGSDCSYYQNVFQKMSCAMRQQLDKQFGIFATTFNGLLGTLDLMKSINPASCTTTWISTAHFQSNILPVQDFPVSVCQFADSMYLSPGKPFYTITQWLNILLQGAAILLLVFGLLSIFGFKVRLPSPIGEENGTDIRPDIPIHPSVSSHRGSYVKGTSSTRNKDITFSPGNSRRRH